ncbi:MULTISPECIES: hypothetical protein [unclassified Luteococcus]|uniref:hypothetical protein n=1 Tax=unclassified Luteococcus TaxID=2639923 RepID=UPI00313D6CB0
MVVVGVELRYYTADWLTGALNQRELMFSDVKLHRKIDHSGTMEASLDLARIVDPEDSLRDAQRVMGLIRPGATSFVAIREGVTTGADGMPINVVMGEWWITEVETQHGSPVITIRGEEIGGYLGRDVIHANQRETTMDPLALALRVLDEGLQGWAHVRTGVVTCGTTIPVSYRRGTRSYMDILRDLQGDRLWMFQVLHSYAEPGGIPSVVRDVRMVAGMPPAAAGEVPIEVASSLGKPWQTPATAADWLTISSVDDLCSELWLFGGGSGPSQLTSVATRPRAAGIPRLSRSVSLPDIVRKGQLDQEAERLIGTVSPEQRQHTVEVLASRISIPTMGRVSPLIIEPSLSMPHGLQADVRVLGWSWEQPQPGRVETLTLTVEVI